MYSQHTIYNPRIKFSQPYVVLYFIPCFCMKIDYMSKCCKSFPSHSTPRAPKFFGHRAFPNSSFFAFMFFSKLLLKGVNTLTIIKAIMIYV